TDERGWLVIEQRDVRVGSLAAVVERKPSPNAYGARRRLILSQSPSAKVNDMNSIIADLAVAGRPEPVPFVVQLFAHERRHWRGTAPEIVVHGGRQGRRCVDGANAVTRPVHQRMRVVKGPDLAAVQVVER